MTKPPTKPNSMYRKSVDEFERRMIASTLESFGGNVVEASVVLQVDHSWLNKRARDLGVIGPARKYERKKGVPSPEDKQGGDERDLEEGLRVLEGGRGEETEIEYVAAVKKHKVRAEDEEDDEGDEDLDEEDNEGDEDLDEEDDEGEDDELGEGADESDEGLDEEDGDK